MVFESEKWGRSFEPVNRHRQAALRQDAPPYLTVCSPAPAPLRPPTRPDVTGTDFHRLVGRWLRSAHHHHRCCRTYYAIISAGGSAIPIWKNWPTGTSIAIDGDRYATFDCRSLR